MVITLKRRPGFYLLNIAFPFWLFVMLSFTSFAVPTTALLSDRISITLSMILTSAAFKIVVSTFTPPVGFATLLDHFMLACFVFMALTAAVRSTPGDA